MGVVAETKRRKCQDIFTSVIALGRSSIVAAMELFPGG